LLLLLTAYNIYSEYSANTNLFFLIWLSLSIIGMALLNVQQPFAVYTSGLIPHFKFNIIYV